MKSSVFIVSILAVFTLASLKENKVPAAPKKYYPIHLATEMGANITNTKFTYDSLMRVVLIEQNKNDTVSKIKLYYKNENLVIAKYKILKGMMIKDSFKFKNDTLRLATYAKNNGEIILKYRYKYDAKGRLSRKTIKRPNAISSWYAINYKYDGKGNVSERYINTFSRSFHFDLNRKYKYAKKYNSIYKDLSFRQKQLLNELINSNVLSPNFYTGLIWSSDSNKIKVKQSNVELNKDKRVISYARTIESNKGKITTRVVEVDYINSYL